MKAGFAREEVVAAVSLRGGCATVGAVEANGRRGAGGSMLDKSAETGAGDCDAEGAASSAGFAEAKGYGAIVVATVSPFP